MNMSEYVRYYSENERDRLRKLTREDMKIAILHDVLITPRSTLLRWDEERDSNGGLSDAFADGDRRST